MAKPGGTPNMQQLLKQAQKMQQQVTAAQEQMAATTVTGSAGGGLVSCVMSGTGELASLSIDPSVVDPQDVETLADLVLAAVRDAHRNAGELQERLMGPVAGGLGPLGL